MANIDLFYSGDEKILFWVVGYTDNTNKVDEIVEMHVNNKQKFIDMGGIGDIKTTYITTSRRYKHMRVYYCDGVENPPEKAFQITSKNGWTMNKWLED